MQNIYLATEPELISKTFTCYHIIKQAVLSVTRCDPLNLEFLFISALMSLCQHMVSHYLMFTYFFESSKGHNEIHFYIQCTFLSMSLYTIMYRMEGVGKKNLPYFK